ncbi:MAG TPA: HPF/RaiA family ribosome-associated protein [Anaeromyxobacteraceae bacterium]|jgi:cold shock CspA family protein/ribosome-associated translation inhibitor RaiA
MKPIQLRWHHVHPSPAVEERVRDKAAQLERFFGRITGCSVALEAPSHHHRQSGPKYRVRVEISVPGATLVVGRDPTKTRAHGDLLAAVNAAFREARRQLQDHARRAGGRTKLHAPPSRAVVAQLFPGDGFGFLRTPDGREVYFHEHSVLRGAFSRLRVGNAVRFAEATGDEGPQASTVAPLRARSRRR